MGGVLAYCIRERRIVEASDRSGEGSLTPSPKEMEQHDQRIVLVLFGAIIGGAALASLQRLLVAYPLRHLLVHLLQRLGARSALRGYLEESLDRIEAAAREAGERKAAGNPKRVASLLRTARTKCSWKCHSGRIYLFSPVNRCVPFDFSRP